MPERFPSRANHPLALSHRAALAAAALAMALGWAILSWVPAFAAPAKTATASHRAVTGSPANAPLFFAGKPDSGAFRSLCDHELGLARKNLAKMLAVRGAKTIQNTLVPYNQIMLHSDNAGCYANLMGEVHPDSAYRATAEGISQAVSKFQSDLSLNRGVYEALKAVNVTKSDLATHFFVKRTLRDFRLAGVDKDEATRKQIAAIREELVLVSQAFDRNIRDDSRTIQVTAADLEGLPDDFIKAHAPGPDGKITIGIEYPDLFPVMTYAKRAETRHRLQLEALNRAYPANMAVLDSLIAKRDRLAHLLGYANWADYSTADKMVGSAKNADAFIQRIGNLTKEQAAREYQVYLKRKQEDDPSATAVQRWEVRYYEQLIRKRDFNFDAQAARVYFPFTQVKAGLLEITSRFFGIQYKRIEHPAVWDPSVEAYEVWEGKRLLGRFFLDLHPRPGKFNHAANFPIRVGAAGIQLPEGALVCNLPGGTPGDPGLMEQTDVETIFHEFGHLLHAILGGHQRWEPISGIATEFDFIEAPSQMLEEWPRNVKILQSFAKHYQTGEPIPLEMVESMRKASVFGRGIDNAFQIYYSALSLNLYNRDPREVIPDSVVARYEGDYIPFPHPPNTHMEAGFGHLGGYSSNYYTYVWSLVIAKDLYSHFDKGHLLAPGAGTRYRRLVLEPGGSKPAAQLVHDFLGRDFSDKAYEEYLEGKD